MADADETLDCLRRAIDGDSSALEAYFTRVRPKLETWIALRVGARLKSRCDVEDLLQETLLQAFKSLPNFDPINGRAAFGWVTRIAENRIRDAGRALGAPKRDPGREVELDGRLEASWTSPSLTAIRREDHERLLEAVSRLEGRHREVLRLVRIEERTYEEAASELSITKSNVGVRIVRALQALRVALDA